jgi:hypothetical protein
MLLILGLRYVIVRVATFKISFIYSYFSLLFFLIIFMIETILSTVRGLDISNFSVWRIFFFYFLEISKLVASKIKLFNLLILITFVFLFFYRLFDFYLKYDYFLTYIDNQFFKFLLYCSVKMLFKICKVTVLAFKKIIN